MKIKVSEIERKIKEFKDAVVVLEEAYYLVNDIEEACKTVGISPPHDLDDALSVCMREANERLHKIQDIQTKLEGMLND